MILDLDFNAEVKGVDISGINEFLGVSKDVDIDTGNPTFYVDYELQPEARSWGIKSIYVFAHKVTGSIEWEIDCWEMSEEEVAMFVKAGGKEYGSGYNHTVSGIIEVDSTVKVNGKEWSIDNQIMFERDGALSINNISIDLSDLTMTLS